MTIADRIKNKRLEKSWSQTDLAIKAGYYDKTTVSKIEHSGNDISMKQVKRIAAALNVTPEYLMGWEREVGLEEQIMYADLEQDTGHIETIKCTKEQLEKAFALLEKYESADKDIKTVVDTLLKRPQQES